ncbi:fumarase, putative [Cryptosporidium muris RN66]|uniref:fumarate hydratase n=1 Tax=Cryptosporidium muris (strain RN66) TaxID=441375 RepID=B6ABD7_CRYMR|nr:fumarase, putative [Cryptosporidium muris RN66]EEA05689.1 fumarase, putative [Cryptosporidium muris RN66]|eukprot:XP_002140038.1 fumarase [Cryptosporidium muris RN66]
MSSSYQPKFSYSNIFRKKYSDDSLHSLETKYKKLEESSLIEQRHFLRSPELNTDTDPKSKDLDMLFVPNEVLTSVTQKAIIYIQHFYRREHLQSLRNIYDDVLSSKNDRSIALELLKNASVASGGILPSCQDTGTACIFAKRGKYIMTQSNDEEAISHGVYNAYTQNNLRYSILSPLSMFEEKNTKCNLPAQIDIMTNFDNPLEYELLVIAKGGGSSSRTFLYQENKSLLNEEKLMKFLINAVRKLGTSGCPPYHLVVVIGGLSPEQCLKTVKLTAAHYLDDLPRSGDETGQAFRDIEWEQKIFELSRNIGIGAQFGGRHFCHDVRVIRLPRHGAHTPVGIGVSCSADRQVKVKINKTGVYMEQLEENPAQFLPDQISSSEIEKSSETIHINLNLPLKEVQKILSNYPVGTRLNLNGTLIIARDIAHARILSNLKETGKLPNYMLKYPFVYYAGPAKTPPNMISGSLGPTTAGRMDLYLDPFMEAGGSFITLAKGNRSEIARQACLKHKGFYLGVPGGPAAFHSVQKIKKLQILDFEDLGMEAVWLAEVENFLAFIVIDDKGNDFYKQWLG